MKSITCLCIGFGVFGSALTLAFMGDKWAMSAGIGGVISIGFFVLASYYVFIERQLKAMP